MPIWGSLLQAAPSLSKMGHGMRQRREGAGSYDIRTGKYYDPGKVERGFVMGTIASPFKALTDPNLTAAEKFQTTIGLGGLVAKKYRKRLEEKRAEEAAKYAAIGQKIEDLPEYQISPEAGQRLAALKESGATMKELSKEASAIAASRTGKEAPGAELIRGDIQQATAEQIEAAQQEGGVNAMKAIASIGGKEQAALGQLSKENIAYKSQAEADLQNMLMSEAQVGAQAAGMEAAGLTGMISERGKQYQSKLDKALTGIDWKINMMAMEQLGSVAQQQARGAQAGALTSGLSQLGSAWLSSKAGK